jgi:hypothetical protein
MTNGNMTDGTFNFSLPGQMSPPPPLEPHPGYQGQGHGFQGLPGYYASTRAPH